jgi:hypothetical protein
MNLKEIILSDPRAKELADMGAADECAKRCEEIAPKVFREFFVTERSIVAIYSDPMMAETVLQKIEAVAKHNPLVARMSKWLGVGSTGIDIGNEKTRRILTTPIDQGGIGLTESETKELFEAAMTKPSISGVDVTNILPLGE